MPENQIEKISTKKDRLLEYISNKDLTIRQFEIIAGLSNGSIGKIKGNISPSMIEKISNAFKDVDWTYIEAGVGKSPVIEAIPRFGMPDPEIFKDNDDKFAYSEEGGVSAMRVKIVPAKAQLGYLRGFADPEYFDTFEYEIIPVEKEARGAYLGFETVGYSMVNLMSEQWAEKSIFPKRVAIGREVSSHLWKSKLHIHSNDAFIIVHKTDGILIKEIIAHDVEHGIITIHSWNPDKQQYPDEDLYLDDIAQIFNVLTVIDKRR
ncbi:helix-turn-helix domain-containing protein [Pedobacter sp. Leaf170]|uniref:helix-turn-helix domain-containing protein n=1 Tax=Pedobacter sp. Leaf170 TaxID=2876558 RepID=UPI001E57FF49|nr:helix-turn-helix domain-containing protein [Pedobacter sp. Leaf170]